MTRRFLITLLIAGGLGAGTAAASSLTFLFQVNTPDFGQPGWIDFSFNQALNSLPATAEISDFHQTGYVLDVNTQSSAGVTGSLSSPPVVIPNDAAGANFFTQGVLSWGTTFSFTLTISGPAVGTAAPDGSAFRLTLFDQGFTPLVSPLPDGEIANVVINPNGSLTAFGSFFPGGFGAVMAVDAVPEPGTALLALGALAALGLVRLRFRG